MPLWLSENPSYLALRAPDLLPPACALQAKAAVLTTDAHFRDIPGLTVLATLD